MTLPTLPEPAMVHMDAQGYSTPCYTSESMQEYAIAALRAQPAGWMLIDNPPDYGTRVLAWLHLPKNPIASAQVVAQRVYCVEDEPESYGEYRLTVGCWWVNGMYYPAGHVTHWMPLPPPPGQERAQPDHSELVQLQQDTYKPRYTAADQLRDYGTDALEGKA